MPKCLSWLSNDSKLDKTREVFMSQYEYGQDVYNVIVRRCECIKSQLCIVDECHVIDAAIKLDICFPILHLLTTIECDTFSIFFDFYRVYVISYLEEGAWKIKACTSKDNVYK